ncbi:MAG: hypothetical protein IH984_12230 [Planctomycetes bacterium]|nr:hypothetical protein [Planctomycetota bacterium]
MKTVIRIVFFVFIISLPTSQTLASQGQNNAAIWYQRAIDVTNSLSNDDWKALMVFANTPTSTPNDRVRKLLSQLNKAQQLVLRGSHKKYSNFYSEIDPDKAETYGSGTLLPYSSHNIVGVPRLAIMMRAQAMVDISDGNTKGASRALAATYKMAQHLSQDLMEGSQSPAYGIISRTSETAQHAIDQGVFSPSDGVHMLNSLRDLGETDQINVIETVTNQYDQTLQWFEAVYESGDTDRLEKYAALFGNNNFDLDNLEEGQFEGMIDQAHDVVDRAVEIMMQGDSEQTRAKLEELNSEIKGTPIAALIPKFRTTTIGGLILIQRVESKIQKQIKTLEILVADELSMNESANAAFWYLRGTKTLDQLGRTQTNEVIKAIIEGSPVEEGSELAESMQKAQEALKLFREASLISNCDFAPARIKTVLEVGQPSQAEDSLTLIPSYLPGMLEAILLLNAEAQFNLSQGNLKDAVDRVATCFRISAHLAHDPIMASSLLSHWAFQEEITLIEKILIHNAWDEQLRKSLSLSFDLMSKKDPFGYFASTTRAYKRLPSAIDFWNSITTKEGASRSSKSIAAWNLDQLIFGLILFEALQVARTDMDVTWNETRSNWWVSLQEPIQIEGISENEARMSAIIFLPDLLAARGMCSLFIPEALKGDLSAISETEVAQITKISELRKNARKELRQANSLINPLPDLK